MTIFLDPNKLGERVEPGIGGVRPMDLDAAAAYPARPQPVTVRPVLRGFKLSVLMIFAVGLCLFLLERVGPAAWKPSAILGSFGGNRASAEILTSLSALRAKVAVEQEEAARAQQTIVATQAENERVTQAYAALYQRGTIVMQTWATNAQTYLSTQMQYQMQAMQSQQGRANLADKIGTLCGLGAILSGGEMGTDCMEGAQDYARSERARGRAELQAVFDEQMGTILAVKDKWKEGLPDPEQMAAYKAKFDRLVPAPPAPIPLPPIVKTGS